MVGGDRLRNEQRIGLRSSISMTVDPESIQNLLVTVYRLTLLEQPTEQRGHGVGVRRDVLPKYRSVAVSERG